MYRVLSFATIIFLLMGCGPEEDSFDYGSAAATSPIIEIPSETHEEKVCVNPTYEITTFKRALLFVDELNPDPNSNRLRDVDITIRCEPAEKDNCGNQMYWDSFINPLQGTTDGDMIYYAEIHQEYDESSRVPIKRMLYMSCDIYVDGLYAKTERIDMYPTVVNSYYRIALNPNNR